MISSYYFLALFIVLCQVAAASIDACHQERLDALIRMGYDEVAYNMADEVYPRIFLGSVCASMDADFMSTHNIGLALSVAGEWPRRGQVGDIVYKHVPGLGDSTTEDSDSVFQIFSLATAIVVEYLRDSSTSNRNVLIYCNMGISRSASVVANVIMHYDGRFSLVEILRDMKNTRPVVRPNALYRSVLERTYSLLNPTKLEF
jgi:hypothetical protein